MSYSCIHCEEEYAEKDFDGIFQVGNYINKAVCGECFWELLENISFRKKLTNKTKLQKLQDKIDAVAKINVIIEMVFIEIPFLLFYINS